MERQKCDEMVKLISIEIFYTSVLGYGKMGGFTVKNAERSDRTVFIQKHMDLLKSIVNSFKIAEEVEIDLDNPIGELGEQFKTFLSFLEDISSRIMVYNGINTTLEEILSKYPLLQEKFTGVTELLKMLEKAL